MAYVNPTIVRIGNASDLVLGGTWKLLDADNESCLSCCCGSPGGCDCE